MSILLAVDVSDDTGSNTTTLVQYIEMQSKLFSIFIQMENSNTVSSQNSKVLVTCDLDFNHKFNPPCQPINMNKLDKCCMKINSGGRKG